jgi:hypothetical protein
MLASIAHPLFSFVSRGPGAADPYAQRSMPMSRLTCSASGASGLSRR